GREPRYEAEEMRKEVRVLAARAREREQAEAGDDRREPRAPRRAAPETAPPRVGREQPERGENGRRRADRAVFRRLQVGVDQIAEKPGREHGQPADARSEIARAEIAEERAERDGAGHVVEGGVHR